MLKHNARVIAAAVAVAVAVAVAMLPGRAVAWTCARCPADPTCGGTCPKCDPVCVHGKCVSNQCQCDPTFGKSGNQECNACQVRNVYAYEYSCRRWQGLEHMWHLGGHVAAAIRHWRRRRHRACLHAATVAPGVCDVSVECCVASHAHVLLAAAALKPVCTQGRSFPTCVTCPSPCMHTCQRTCAGMVV